MKKIVVLGKNGQVASALKKTQSAYLDVVYIGRDEADFENKNQVLDRLQNLQPQIIINAVAYTAVDKAEEEKLKCYKINTETPGYISKWCQKNKAIFIQYSTDYVFDGQKEGLYNEVDLTNPLSVYGKSKRDAEALILQENPSSYIFRTSWVYDESGKNFLNTMIKLADKDELKIVTDQTGSPTYALDIASATWRILKSDKFGLSFGIYHMVSQGRTTWINFAEEIFEQIADRYPKTPKLSPILTKEYQTAAQRPLNSQLDTTKLYETFGVQLPYWKDSLKVCLKNKFF